MWYNILLRKESYCSAPGPGHSAGRQLPKLACLLMRREAAGAAVEKRCSTQHIARRQDSLHGWGQGHRFTHPHAARATLLAWTMPPWRTTQMRCQQRNNICRENLCPALPCVRPCLKPCMDRTTTSFVCRMLDTAKVRCVLAVALLLDLY